MDLALELEPRIAAAYWQRHLIRLLRHQRHEALDDLNALLKIDSKCVHAYRLAVQVLHGVHQGSILGPLDNILKLQHKIYFYLCLAFLDCSNLSRRNPRKLKIDQSQLFLIRSSSFGVEYSCMFDFTKI